MTNGIRTGGDVTEEVWLCQRVGGRIQHALRSATWVRAFTGGVDGRSACKEIWRCPRTGNGTANRRQIQSLAALSGRGTAVALARLWGAAEALRKQSRRFHP